MKATKPPPLPAHGGDISWATERFGAPADGWLDLSTGINPHTYPVRDADPAQLTRLPDPARTRALADAARACFGVPEGVALAPLPGSEIAIRQLPFLIRSEKTAIVGPTYPSHAAAWSETGHEVVDIRELDQVPGDINVVVIANPNNPDGRTVALDPMAAVAARLAARGGTLVVDEAYADVAPEVSMMPLLGEVSALVVRSFGKFFGLPGLRLGFVAGSASAVERLAARIGDWPVSGLAVEIGLRALADDAWQQAMRAQLADEAAALDEVLTAGGLSVIGGTSLFRLAEHADAHRLYEDLGRRGILVRAFAARPTWLRIGLPPEGAARDRLADALAAIAA